MNLFSRSLFNKIKILGLILGVLVLFILLIAYEAKTLRTKRDYIHHAIKISQLLDEKSENLARYLQKNSIQALESSQKPQLTKQKEELISDPFIREVFTKAGIALYRDGDSVFFLIKQKEKTFYFHSKRSFFSSTILPIGSLALLFFITLFGIYHYIKNAFSPLVRLEKNIEHFSKGQDIEIVYEDAHDEIANIANAFYGAVEHNKLLKLQKDMYICMVMHEISTPLTKAKFITHFMESEEEKNKLNALFDSMQNELDKLHEFESINTQISQMHISTFSLNALLEDVCDVLLLEESEIDIESEEVEIAFDYNLFIVAIKNLIDNALKYSPNRHVSVSLTQTSLKIKNSAIENQALEIENLLKPFKQGNECSSGMGLGLFLIDEIITKHNFTLNYLFHNKEHIFTVNF